MIKTYITRVAGVATVVGLLAVSGTAYATVPTFSQTGITVGVGQSTSVTSANGTPVYIESNSTPTIVSAVANGTQLTFTGLAPGSSIFTVCGVGTASDCTNLGVTVQVGSVSGLTFSQNNLSLAIGSNQSVTVSGGTGIYSISSNSNPTVASTNLSGNTLMISGLAIGGATINVCDSSQICGALTVTIGSSSATSTTGLSFSEGNISLAAGSTQSVTIYGGDGTYQITNDSNSSVVSPGTSGNSVIVDALAVGSATLTVCDTTRNVCGTLPVTVTASIANQAVTFNPSNPTIAVGGSLNVTLSGGATGYVVLSNQNANVVTASVSNTTLLLEGTSAGADSLTICATGGGCNSLSVTVTGTGSTSTATSFTTTTTPAPTTTTTVTGSVVPNVTLLSEIRALQAALTETLSQIESMQTQLNQIVAQVSAGGGSGIGTSVSASSGSGTFTELLTLGSTNAQVTALQNRLTVLGFYSGPVTGYYGALTEAAVMKYQTAHGISATGEVGPSTQAALNVGT